MEIEAKLDKVRCVCVFSTLLNRAVGLKAKKHRANQDGLVH